MTTDRVRALWYVNPDRVTEDVTKSGKLKYKVTTGGSTMMVDATGMLHVVGPMSDAGYTGRSVITTFRETLGLGLALERYGSEFFANAATPRRVLSTSARLSTEAHARLRTSLNDAQTGPGRRHNPRARRGGSRLCPSVSATRIRSLWIRVGSPLRRSRGASACPPT